MFSTSLAKGGQGEKQEQGNGGGEMAVNSFKRQHFNISCVLLTTAVRLGQRLLLACEASFLASPLGHSKQNTGIKAEITDVPDKPQSYLSH